MSGVRSPLLSKKSDSCVARVVERVPEKTAALNVGLGACSVAQTVYECVALGESGAPLFSKAALIAGAKGLAVGGTVGLGVAACTFFACKAAKKHIENSDLAATPSAPTPVAGMTK